MNLWRRALKRLFTDKTFEGLSFDENMAILEALEIGIVADGEITDEELRMFRADVLKLPWAWNLPEDELENIVEASRAKLETLRDDEDALLEQTENLVERIPEGPVREAVYEMMVELSLADGSGDWERDILEVFRKRAGIPEERAREIVARFNRGVVYG